MDPESLLGGDKIDSLTETSVRHGFIRKVYGIVCVQLIVTTVLGGMVMNFAATDMYQHPGFGQLLLFGSLAMSVALLCTFSCKPELMRSYPLNFILLSLFTLAESVLVGFICVQYTKVSVICVLAVTAVIVAGLTLFACQTAYDFSGFGPYLMCAVMSLIAVNFVQMGGAFLGYGASPAFQFLHMAAAAVGAFIFSAYIVYDTQLIVGGKHHRQFAVDDYAMAAINLYVDIVQLFLQLLSLFGDRK